MSVFILVFVSSREDPSRLEKGLVEEGPVLELIQGLF